MDREFEYQAMYAMSGVIVGTLDSYMDWTNASDVLAGLGIGLAETQLGFVAYPNNSPRKNPACLVITDVSSRGTEWRSLFYEKGYSVLAYEAGKYDLAKQSEITSVRGKKEDKALRS